MTQEGKLFFEILGAYFIIGITFTFVCFYLRYMYESKKQRIPSILDGLTWQPFLTTCAWGLIIPVFFAVFLFEIFPKWLAQKCVNMNK